MSWLNESAVALVSERRLLPMTDADRQKWLAKRRGGVGASDAPVILGLSKWKSAYQLWHEKLGLYGRQEMTEPQLLGLLFEANVAALYEIRTGRRTHTPREFVQHPRAPFRYANLDRVCDDRIVQVKLYGSYGGWGPDGSDEVPADILAQVTHEMDCAGAALCDVAALVCGTSFRVYTVPFNPALAERIAESQHEFWGMVQARRPPPIDWHHPGTAAFVEDLCQAVPGSVIDARQDFSHPAYQEAFYYLQANRDIRAAEGRKAEARAKIVVAMGEASRLRLPSGITVSRGKQFRVNDPNHEEDGG